MKRQLHMATRVGVLGRDTRTLWVDVDEGVSAHQIAAQRTRRGEVLLTAEWVEFEGQESLL